ncbi:3-hydroxyacyl-CoA dehydrogenase family protein [Bacillus sp. FJAT-45350]|uniref:3-hydroxyacyl-CoA dehydrogenase family protein n=1 Tax=Bacillus sp. FJAT-45350 TaxID=2011014 RepID=UPI000BB68E4E|nr:3-hydroxyacyl-CoA dehydrogenase family protein [Bacillus sp. FJAT-45350]
MSYQIGVIGSGIMGRGITEACLLSGFKVKLYDIDSEALSKAVIKVKNAAERKAQPKLAQGLENLESCNKIEDFQDCDLVIEAATEKLDVKKSIFQQVENVVSEHAILASNTSGISITAIASSCTYRNRVIGLHFFNPAQKMPLVEVINGLETSSEVTEKASEFVKALEKTPILAKDVPGFVVNKIVTPMLNEAMHMLDNGVASKEDIDQAMKLGMGHPMGPLELSDFIGLDTLLHFLEHLHNQTGLDHYRPSNLLRQKVTAGHLGRKTGRGFYNYE